MKKIFSLMICLVFALFCINLVSAGCGECNPCEPDAGFVKCHECTRCYDGAIAGTMIQRSDIKGDARPLGYYVGEVWMDLEFFGHKFYMKENVGEGFTSTDSCGASGCDGKLIGTASNSWTDVKVVLADADKYTSTPQEYTDCPTFLAWSCDGDCGNSNAPDPWVWSSMYMGWRYSGNCFNIKSVECYYDTDCPEGMFCDWGTTPNEWRDLKCEKIECTTGEKRCVGSNLELCQNNKFVPRGIVYGECGVECLDNSHCDEGPFGGEYCSNEGDIVQDYKIPRCRYGKCQRVETTKIVKDCLEGCEGGQCIEDIPSNGGDIIDNNTLLIIGGVIAGLVIIIIIFIKFNK